MSFHQTMPGRVLALGAISAVVLGTPYDASAATTSVKAAVRKGVLTVTGTTGPDVITLRLRQGDPATVEVDLGADGTADAAVNRDLFTSIVVSGAGGADQLTLDSMNGVFTDTETTTLDGGTQADVLIGTVAAERLVGGAGDDLLQAGYGTDVVMGGDGADTASWQPGSGNDTIDGGAGADQLQFQAANVSDTITLSATPAGHVRLTRDIASIELDLTGLESIDLRTLGGADTVTVADLHGTGLGTVTADLVGPTGDDAQTDTVATPSGVVAGQDGAAAVLDGLGARLRVVNGGIGDLVQVSGTAALDERVTVAGTDTAETVTGLTDGTSVLVRGATPGVDLRLTDVDRVDVRLAGGDDSYASYGGVAAVTSLDVDGGGGADTLSGGYGPEILSGADGDDVIHWGPGGSSDVIDGGAGNDRLAFFASNVSETLDLSASADGHVRLARNIGNTVLDLSGIETADLTLLGGSDDVLVDDLSGTALTTVNADLSSSLGTPDGLDDEVILFGTSADDTVTVTADTGAVVANGLAASVRISGADPTLDLLRVYALRGNDSVTATPEAAALILLALFA